MLAEMCLLAGNHYVKLSRRWIARAEGRPTCLLRPQFGFSQAAYFPSGSKFDGHDDEKNRHEFLRAPVLGRDSLKRTKASSTNPIPRAQCEGVEHLIPTADV